MKIRETLSEFIVVLPGICILLPCVIVGFIAFYVYTGLEGGFQIARRHFDKVMPDTEECPIR